MSEKDMGIYDGWTCLAIVFSHVIFLVGKVQQLATAQSMHSMLFFGTNGLNKVYTVFRPSVFAISAMIFGRFICKLVFVWVHAITMILWIYGFMDLSNCTIVR